MSEAPPTPGPSRPPAALRKQPKNAARKSKEERDRLEREEAKRRAERLRAAQADERAAEASRKAAYGFTNERGGRDGRGGGRGGATDSGRGRVISRPGRGGRGGFMGGGGLPSRSTGASDRSRGGASRAGYKREGGTRVSVKTDPDGDVSMLGLPSQVKHEREREYIDLDSEEEDAHSLIDVEDFKNSIVIHDDDSAAEDDEATLGSMRGIRPGPKEKIARELGIPPVRVTRVAHSGRQLGINTEASTSSVVEAKRLAEGQDGEKTTAAPASRTKGKGKDIQYIGETHSFKGVYVDEDEDNLAIKPDPEAPIADTATEEAKAKAKTATRTRRKSSTKHAKNPIALTAEEIKENQLRKEEAISILEELLDAPAQQTTAATRLQDENGEDEPLAQGEAAEDEKYDRRKDNVYLFQLPPIMPGLINPAIKVKQEKPIAKTEADPKETAPVSSGQPKPSVTESNPVKIEDDGTNDIRGGSRRDALEAGCIGKLRVHKSGKTSLSWGGTSLQLSMGMNARFLQSVVLMELPDNDQTATNMAAGRAMSFGSVRGKFVVTPDWNEILR